LSAKGQRAMIDLSHTIEDGMITYPGLPPPAIADFLSRAESRSHYSEGTEFHIGRIDMCANTGTYIDTPFHRYPNGVDLAALPLDLVADLEGIMIDVTDARDRAVDRRQLASHDVAGKAVLVRTGWDRHWGTDAYFEAHHFLTEDAAAFLVDGGAVLVGIDSLNIDDTSGGTRPVHSMLLGAGIPICEHLTNLGELPNDGFRFSAIPAKVRGLGNFPVRAFAALVARENAETSWRS
jgi:arylformamidase